jgi:Skp family chaperone for outer membrane proteins
MTVRQTLVLGSLTLVAVWMAVQRHGESTAIAGAAPAGAREVAVVDLDKLSQAMGWSQIINSQLEADKKDLERSLTDIRDALNKQLEEERKKIAATITPKEKQEEFLKMTDVINFDKFTVAPQLRDEYVRMVAQANQMFRSNVESVNQVLSNRKNLMIKNYRDAVRPIASTVSKKLGYALVIIPSDYLLVNDGSADITDQVTSEVQKVRPQVAPLPPATSTQPGAKVSG